MENMHTDVGFQELNLTTTVSVLLHINTNLIQTLAMILQETLHFSIKFFT